MGQKKVECIHLWSIQEGTKECLKCGALKVESPDVPKDHYQILMDARAKLMYIAANAHNDDLQQQANIAWQEITNASFSIKELADLRAERDDLKQQRDRWVKYCDVHIEEENKLKAERDKLKEEVNSQRELKEIAIRQTDYYLADNERLKEAVEGTLKFVDEIIEDPQYKESPRLRLGVSMVKVKLQSYLENK